MKTFEELELESEMTGYSMHELMYKELRSVNNPKLNTWLEVMVDFCNNYDGNFEFFPEMMEAMIKSEYEPEEVDGNTY